MTHQTKLERLGATPGKLALVAVLAIVLVVVIVKQLPSRSPARQATASAAKKLPVPNTKAVVKPTESPRNTPQTKKQQEQIWPKVNLDDFLAHDPFRTPLWAVQQTETTDPTETDEPGKLDELQKQGVSIVMIAEGAKAARIGENKVHVGDVLEGYQITDITSQGVVLNKLDSQ